MSKQSVRQAARRSALDAQAVLRKERADRERRLEALAVAVLTALGERDAAVRDAERRAGEALRTMTIDEGLSLREAVEWCGSGGLTVREVTRKSMRSRVVRPLTPPEGVVSRTGDAHGMIKATQRHEIPDGHDSAEASLANNGRCHITSEVTIRAIRVDDRERWEPLWQGYLDFYRAVLTPEVTEGTWVALCDPTSAVYGLVAEQEDQLAGFAHLVLHPTTWATHPTCYLEDLYVAKPWRGGDIARRLIEAVYAFADGFGPASVYWLTQEYNAPARSLYDTLAHRTSFVVYRR